MIYCLHLTNTNNNEKWDIRWFHHTIHMKFSALHTILWMATLNLLYKTFEHHSLSDCYKVHQVQVRHILHFYIFEKHIRINKYMNVHYLAWHWYFFQKYNKLQFFYDWFESCSHLESYFHNLAFQIIDFLPSPKQTHLIIDLVHMQQLILKV